MKSIPSFILSVGLTAVGLGMAMVASKGLWQVKVLDMPYNPGGIRCSPYGEVLAIGLQGKVDTYFHGGAHSHAHGDHGHDHGSHEHGADEGCAGCAGCQHEHEEEEKAKAVLAKHGLNQWLSEMDHEWEERTNPVAPSPALKFYQRRQAEDRLRFAYLLDPSNFGNYVSYHFFLCSSLGTRPELTPQAEVLTNYTIQYCLAKQGDLQASLTAAAAVDNQLDKLQTDYLREEKKPSVDVIREKLQLLQQCLAHHVAMKQEWQKNGEWQKLSVIRQREYDEMLDYAVRSQKGRIKTQARIEQMHQTGQTPPFLIAPTEKANQD